MDLWNLNGAVQGEAESQEKPVVKQEIAKPETKTTQTPTTLPTDPEVMLEKYKLLKMELEQKQEELKNLEDQIKGKALEHGNFAFGGVIVKVNKGRKTYDYETGGQKAPKEIVEKYTAQKIDWKKVCTEAGLDAPVLKQADRTVTIKIRED